MAWVELAVRGVKSDGLAAIHALLRDAARQEPLVEETRDGDWIEADDGETAAGARFALKVFVAADPPEALDAVEAALAAAGLAWDRSGPDQTNWSEAWKDHHAALVIGRRLVIRPPFSPSPAPERLDVVIDPGMGFGTGAHPSTALCLERLEAVVRPGDLGLDLGCGSGVLALAALRLGARRMIAVDVERHAIDAARTNAAANHLASSIALVRGTTACLGSGFDLVVVNIESDLIHRDVPGLFGLARPGGRLVLGGVRTPHRAAIATTLSERARVVEAADREGFTVFVARLDRPAPIG